MPRGESPAENFYSDLISFKPGDKLDFVFVFCVCGRIQGVNVNPSRPLSRFWLSDIGRGDLLFENGTVFLLKRVRFQLRINF